MNNLSFDFLLAKLALKKNGIRNVVDKSCNCLTMLVNEGPQHRIQSN